MIRPFAVLFPGQGAQEVGMGRDLLRTDRGTTALMDAASEATGEDLARLCIRGPDRRLADTRFLQPALTAVCLGLWARFQDEGAVPSAAAGHSVGELSALAASGAADPADAVRTAAIRGRAMQSAAKAHDGAMAAVSGIPAARTEALLAEEGVETAGVLVAAAVNSPEQVTVSGDSKRVRAFAEKAKREGARVTLLRVSGAWHSPHMAAAVPVFREAMARISLAEATVPMVLNRDGRATRDPNALRESLPGQLVSPVRWDLVMRTLQGMGIRDYVEIGPGKVLRGLVRLNDTSSAVTVHNVADLRGLERAVSALKAC